MNHQPYFTNFILSYKNKNSYSGALYYLNYVMDLFMEKDNQSPYLAVLNDSITNSCNGKCLYCCADSGESSNTDVDLSNNFIKLIKQNPPIIFSISGGEPLLFPQKCLKYFKVFSGFSFLSLLTNLSLPITDEIDNVLFFMSNSKESFIQTSIDSTSKKIHNILRANTDLDLIISNIDYIRHKYPNIKLKLNCTVSEINCDSLNKIVDFAIDHKIESIHFNTVLPFGRASKSYSIDGLFSIIDAMMALSCYENYLMIKEHTISFPNEIIQFLAIENGKRLLNSNYMIGQKYDSKKYTLHIDENKRTMDIGWGKTVSNSLSNKIYTTFVKLNENNTDYSDECKKCGIYTLCNQESFYLGECLLKSLYNKMNVIISTTNKPAKFETNIDKLFDYIKSSIPYSNITIYSTRNCNGNCNFCQVFGDRMNAENQFHIHDLIRFLNGNRCFVTITGGEPLVDIRRIEKMILELKKENNIITLLTNGVLYDKKFLETLKKNFTKLDVIQISIYSNNPYTHYLISGRNDWDLLDKCILDFIQSGINVRLNLTLTPLNVSQLSETFEHYKGLGAEQICINGLLRKGKAKNMFDLKHAIKYINSLYKFCISNYDGYSFVIPVELLRIYSNISDFFIKDHKQNSSSMMYDEKINTLSVDYNGNILIDTTNEEVGTIEDCILDNIIAKYGNISTKRDLINTACKDCHSYDLCKAEEYKEEIYDEFHDFNHSCCDEEVQLKLFGKILTY